MRITKVFGPYAHAGGFRLIVCGEDGTKNSRQFRTQAEAYEVKDALQYQIEQHRSMSVEVALEHYAVYLRADRGCRPGSIATTLIRLRDFFGDLARPVGALTPAFCAERYAHLVQRKTLRTGRPVAADTHRNVLAESRTFARWCITKGLLGNDPFEKVKAVGRRQHGKQQLRLDEAKVFVHKGLELASLGEDGAIAALVALLMGLRSSEIISREARDLDDDGKVLVIEKTATFEGKSKAATRRPDVPELLRPHLQRLASGKRPNEKLFGHHDRDWVRAWVHKICDAIGLPRVTAHGLRGMWSTAAADAGMGLHAVARLMGHSSPVVTQRFYIKPGTVEARGRRELLARVNPRQPKPKDEGK